MDNHNSKCSNGFFVNPIVYFELDNSKSYFCTAQAPTVTKHTDTSITHTHTNSNDPKQEICRRYKTQINKLEKIRLKLIKRSSKMMSTIETVSGKLLKQYESAINCIKTSYNKFRATSSFSVKDSEMLFSIAYDFLDSKINHKLNTIYKETKDMLSDTKHIFPNLIMNLFYSIESNAVSNNKKLKLLKKINSSIDIGKVTAVAAKHSQSLIVYGTENSTLHYFNADAIGNNIIPDDSGRQVCKNNPIKVIEITKHGVLAIIGTQQGQVVVFDLATKRFTKEYKNNASIYAISSSNYGDFAFQDFTYNSRIITSEGRIHKIDANNLNNTKANLIKFSPNGKWVFLAKNNDHAIQYSLVDQSSKNLWYEEKIKIHFIEVSKIASFVAICSAKNIKVFDYNKINSHKPLISYQSKKDITFVSFTKMNNKLCFFGYSNGILLFTLPSKEPRKLKTKSEIILCIGKYPELKYFSGLIKL